ncbi:hypothetical protein GOFOIKOB_6411 [Methylobacterium tardum]|nr:hypothetical protein [Methylobacterium tardum]URD40290.1 hypothetical protein M6G65_33110 [Methylobacterium tardum]GJE53332.1 hypothetical protein GOFOIKOB_6411 [Methylobacterium tardum]
MLDVVFWWCAVVAFAGSAALIGLALLAGRSLKSQPTGIQLTWEEPVPTRYFGRA